MGSRERRIVFLLLFLLMFLGIWMTTTYYLIGRNYGVLKIIPFFSMLPFLLIAFGVSQAKRADKMRNKKSVRKEKVCQDCGALIDSSEKKCPKCGSDQT